MVWALDESGNFCRIAPRRLARRNPRRMSRGRRIVSTPSQPESVAPEPKKAMSLRGAVFLGVGAMVGAGIFALLGEAGAVAGAAVWISFIIAGIMSAALGYTLVKFGQRYPSSGGIIVYLLHGFQSRRLVGVAAWLGYLTAIVVVGAMVAISFGDYAAAVFFRAPSGGMASKLCAVALVIGATVMSIAGPRVVDRIQSWIVWPLLLVFAVFIVATIGKLDLTLLSPSQYPSWAEIIASVALTFFAFLGFAVISFAAGDLANPEREIPRAMYGALAITTVLYVLVALCVFGTLTVEDVVRFGPTAIAEAARPTLGDAGFALMAVAALLATASSVTATLYASDGLTKTLAAERIFPRVFGADSRLGSHGGLLITGVLSLLFVTVLGLGALASIGSAVSLAVFALVAIGAFRLRKELQANAAIVILAITIAGIVLIGFAVDLARNDLRSLVIAVALVILALVAQLALEASQRRGSANATQG